MPSATFECTGSTWSMPFGRSVSATSLGQHAATPSGVAHAGFTTIGAPDGERRRDLVRHQVQREVERRDAQDRAEREPAEDRRRVRSSAASVSSRIELVVVRGGSPRTPSGTSTTARVASTFAHFSGLPPSRAISSAFSSTSLGQAPRDVVERLGAQRARGRRWTPRTCRPRPGDGLLDVGVGRDADLGHHAVVERALDLERALARPPLAVHQKGLIALMRSPPSSSAASRRRARARRLQRRRPPCRSVERPPSRA